MDRRQEQLGEILIKKGFINIEQLKDALNEQQRTKEFLGSILIRKNYIKKKSLLEALSHQYNIPIINLKYKYVNWKFVSEFSSSLILEYKCFPIERDEWSVTFAITNPLDVWTLEKSEKEAKGLRVKLVLVSEEDMKEAIQRYQQYIRGTLK